MSADRRKEVLMALNVGPVFKKNLNRGGLFLVVIGVAMNVLGGGDVSAAMELAQTGAGILGGLLILAREILG